MDNNAKIKLGTIGTSKIASEFVAAALKTEQYELISVYSRKYETGKEFADSFGCENVYTTLEEMANSGIEAIYIASPNRFHYEQAMFFLKNKIHVICEKPICSCLNDYVKLFKESNDNNLICMEAIMSYHAASHTVLKEALNEIGNIKLARFDFCQRSSRLDKFYAGEHVNIFDMNLHAGTLNDLGVYCVYAAVDLFDTPDKLYSSASYFENGADCSGTAIFKYNNFDAVLSYSKAGQSSIGSEIIGDMGTIKIKSISQYTGISLVKNGVEKELFGTPSKIDVMMGEALNFADFVRGNEKEKYNDTVELQLGVHEMMDNIKHYADIKYPDLEI